MRKIFEEEININNCQPIAGQDTRFPGNIFQDSDEEGLGRTEIFSRLKYLVEEIGGGLPLQKELEHQATKLRLLKRLNELIREQIAYIEKHKSDGAL